MTDLEIFYSVFEDCQAGITQDEIYRRAGDMRPKGLVIDLGADLGQGLTDHALAWRPRPLVIAIDLWTDPERQPSAKPGLLGLRGQAKDELAWCLQRRTSPVACLELDLRGTSAEMGRDGLGLDSSWPITGQCLDLITEHLAPGAVILIKESHNYNQQCKPMILPDLRELALWARTRDQTLTCRAWQTRGSQSLWQIGQGGLRGPELAQWISLQDQRNRQ